MASLSKGRDVSQACKLKKRQDALSLIKHVIHMACRSGMWKVLFIVGLISHFVIVNNVHCMYSNVRRCDADVMVCDADVRYRCEIQV